MNAPSARTRAVLVVVAAAAAGLGVSMAGHAGMAVAAALTVLIIGLWATGALPEHLVAVLFFVLAVVLSVAPQSVVLSGFLSSALWLVFGGLVLGVAVQRTGLGRWLASGVVARIGSSYPRVIAAVIAGNVLLGFLVPSAMARAVILMPIVVALAEHLGFAAGDRGRTGMVVASAVCGYVVPATILPANLPNAVLLGAADTLYDLQITYVQYLVYNFPVNGYTLVALPYQVGPIVFALVLGGARFADAARLMLPLVLLSAVVLMPLTYLWWRAIGALG